MQNLYAEKENDTIKQQMKDIRKDIEILAELSLHSDLTVEVIADMLEKTQTEYNELELKHQIVLLLI